jgi:transcriptional regulator with XRE-family HTH domain
MSVDGFASKLKQLREAAGLSQADLAERAGMNVFGVAKLEQGVREPTWATVQALARALAVSVEAFVVAPSAGEPPGRSRRPTEKAADAEPVPKRPRGRPRKEASGQEDAQAADATAGRSGTGKGKPKGTGK